ALTDALWPGTHVAYHRRCDNGGHKSIEPVQQAAVARNDLARILHAKLTLDGRLKQVAQLGYDRDHSPEQQHGREFAIAREREGSRKGNAADDAADRSRPGFLGTDAHPELWAADAAADEVTENVGDPHHEEDEDQRQESVRWVAPDENAGEQRA